MKKVVVIMVLMMAFCVNIVSAQETNKIKYAVVKGDVIDVTNQQPLVGAIVLVSGTEKGSITDVDGKFVISGLELNKETELEITFVGYSSQVVKVTPTSEEYIIAKPISMTVENMRIKDVEVAGSAPTAVIVGDTVKFNASAYKTNPDATASDLIEKMPGFQKNDDGTVSSTGEKVERILVDGKSFFKNDPATALNALDADMIESIELYDDSSDKSKFTGMDDGTEVKTINIVTKRRLGDKPAYILEIIGGGGFEDKYQGSVNYTHIEGDRQISIIGGANNININPMQQRRGFGRGNTGGENEQAAIALNYTNALKNDGEIGLSYSFYRKETDKVGTTLRTYFPSPEYTDYTYLIQDSSLNVLNTHRFSVDLKTNLGETTQITFRPQGTITTNDDYSSTFDLSSRDGDYTTSSRETNSDINSYAISGDLNLLQKISDKNYFSLRFKGDINNSTSDKYIIGSTIYETLMQDTTISQDQENNIFNDNNSVEASAEFTQKVGEYGGISLNYDFAYNWSENDRQTYLVDEMTGEVMDELDPTLSNHFLRDYYTNTFSTRYNYNTDAIKMVLSAGYRIADLENEQLYPDNGLTDNYTFNGAVVSARMKYQKSKESPMLMISYRGTPTYPSVSQLQEVINNDNPLQLSSGNSNLQQGFQNSLRLHYRGANMEKSTFYGAFARVNYTLNGVVNNTTLFDEATTIEIGGLDYNVQAGTQYTTLTNMDGSFDATLGGMYSMPFELIKSKVNIMGMYRYSNMPSMYNGEEYFTKSSSFNLNLGLNSNISQNIDFNINNSATYELSSSNMVGDNNYFVNNLRFNLYVNVWNNMFVSSDYSLRYQYLENTPLDDPFTNIVNISLGKKFGKNNQYEIRASVYDLLNQNINISQQVSDIYLAETIANDLSRYVSLTFTYKFNSIRNMANKFREDGHPGGDGPGSGRRGGGGGHGGGRPF